jgi:hypothetical protein
MNRTLLLKPIQAIAGSALLITGCVTHEHISYRNPPTAVVTATPTSDVLYVNTAPPAPIVEVATVAPGPGFVWVGGAWNWQGRWVWQAGRWGRPPRFGAVWVGPRHRYYGGRYMWYRGHWR